MNLQKTINWLVPTAMVVTFLYFFGAAIMTVIMAITFILCLLGLLKLLIHFLIY